MDALTVWPWPTRVFRSGPGGTKVSCDIWVAGFFMTRNHLHLLCYSHGLTLEQIERKGLHTTARQIMARWRGGVDLIQVETSGDDGTPFRDYLLILRVAPQFRGQPPPLDDLKYSPAYAEALPTIFSEDFLCKEEYFPGRKLPWTWIPWPLYLYSAFYQYSHASAIVDRMQSLLTWPVL